MGLNTPPWKGRLDERYDFLHDVGAGASSQVFCARDVGTGEKVAVKVHLNTEDEDRFNREVTLVSSLDSPHFQRYVSHGKLDSGHNYMVLAWLEGKDLGAWFEGHALTLAQAAHIILGVARGLADLHRRGIVHRDIKPANIFLLDPKGTLTPKIIDLGVATFWGDTREEGAQGLVGTPSYMSPELASMEAEEITPATDVYSLCAVYYELLTGRRPHEHAHLPLLLSQIIHEQIAWPKAFNPAVPDALEALIMKGLSREAKYRHPDGEALVRELEALVAVNYQGGQTARSALADAATDLPEKPGETRTVALVLLMSRAREITRLTDHAIYEQINSTVKGMGGLLYTLEDGSVLGIFGAERSQGDEMQRALSAALRLKREFYLMAAVVLGKFGGDEELKPSVALAERLLEQPGTTEGVRVDGNVARRAVGEFVVVRKKGFSVIPFAADWQARRAQILVGREREKRLSLAFLQQLVRESRPAVLLLTGHDGMGKSSLCTWLYHKAVTQGMRTYAAVAHGDFSEHPYGLIERLLSARAGLAVGQATQAREALLAQFLARHRNHEEALKMLWEGPDASATQDYEALRWRLWEAVGAVVEADLATGPLYWIVDDIHQMDRSSERLIHWLLTSARGGLGLIATVSPSGLKRVRANLPRDVRVTEVGLGALSRDQVRNLIKRHMAEPHPDEVRSIISRADGNPLFVEELALLYRHGSGDRAVTRNLQMLVQAGIDRLGPDAAGVARTASVLGERGRLKTLRYLMPEVDLDACREELEQAGIWNPYPVDHVKATRNFRFKHAITRDAVYQLLPKRVRTEIHRNTAAYFDQAESRDPRRAARHLLSAGEKEKAAACLLEMAWRAHAAADSETTLQLVGKVRKLGILGQPKQEVLYLRAAAHTWMGRLALALDDIKELLALEDVPPNLRARAACLGCLQLRRLSRTEEGVDMSQIAIEEAGRADNPRLLAKAYLHAAFAYYDAGNVAAVAQYNEALADIKNKDARIQGFLLEAELLLTVMEQRFEDAVELGKKVLDLSRRQAYARLGANVANVGLCLRHLGRFSEALPYLTMARAIYARQSNRLQRYDTIMNEGRLLGLLGRYEEALTCLTEANEGLARAGETHFNMVATALQARVHAARNQDGDMALALELLSGIEADGAMVQSMETVLAGMEVFLLAGEMKRAVYVAELALDLLDTHGSENEHSSEVLAYVTVCLDGVGHPRAAEAAARCKERLKRLLQQCPSPSSQHGLRHNIRAHQLFLAEHPL